MPRTVLVVKMTETAGASTFLLICSQLEGEMDNEM